MLINIFLSCSGLLGEIARGVHTHIMRVTTWATNKLPRRDFKMEASCLTCSNV